MIKYKYRTGGWGNNTIEQIEVTKETDKSVWVVGEHRRVNRELKRTGYRNYFDTWEEAKAFLLEAAEGKCVTARRMLELANGHLGNIKGLKKPE